MAKHRAGPRHASGKAAPQTSGGKHRAGAGRHASGRTAAPGRPGRHRATGPRHSSGQTRPQTGQGQHRVQPQQPQQTEHRTAREPIPPKQTREHGPVFSAKNVVKGEFFIGLFLLLLSPIGNPNVSINKDFARRIIAWLVLFMILFPMGNAQNPRVSRIGAGLGALVLIAITVRGVSSGLAIDVTGLMKAIVAKLQPGGSGSSSGSGNSVTGNAAISGTTGSGGLYYTTPSGTPIPPAHGGIS